MLALANASAQIGKMLPDEVFSPEQIAILRRMTLEKRMRIAERAYWSVRGITEAGVRSRQPDWSDEQVAKEVSRLFLTSRTGNFFLPFI
jgi:hypothetical protein